MTTAPLPHSKNQSLSHIGGAPGPRGLIESSDLLSQWRRAVQDALSTRHLVDVASELAGTVGGRTDDLATLGVPVDLLECFPEWRRGLRTPFQPGQAGLRLAPSGAGVPIGTLRLQMSPAGGTIPYALPAVYRFVSGVPALDEDAARRMRQAGVDPVPVSTADVASALMLLQGGLHCCCGSM